MARKTNCSINGTQYYRKYATINGKRIMVYGESEKEWKEKVKELQRKESLGMIYTTDTVGNALDTWMYYVFNKKPIRKTTYSIYEGIFRNLIAGSDVCKVKMKDVKSIHVQNYYNKLENQGKSAHSIQNAKKVLNMFFKYAVSEGYLLKNPCDNANAPKAKRPESIEVFTDSEIERIKKALDGDRDRFIFVLALSTGCRIGELLALRHQDVGKTIEINKEQTTIRHINKGEPIRYELTDGPPKTSQSYRMIPIPDSVLKEYEAHKHIYKLEYMKRGSGAIKEDDHLFLTKNGIRWQTAQIQKKWKYVLAKAEVDYKKFHTLRHTYITKLIQSGINIVTVMQLAGHSNLDTTLRYTHIEIEHKEKALDVIDQLVK